MSQTSSSKKSKDKSSKKRTREALQDDEDQTARMSKKIIVESNRPNEIIVVKKQLPKDPITNGSDVTTKINTKSKKSKPKTTEAEKKQEQQQNKQQISLNTRSRKGKSQQQNTIQEEMIENPHQAQQKVSPTIKESKKKKKKQKQKEEVIEKMEEEKINSTEKDQLSSPIEQNTKESSAPIKKKKKSKKKKQKQTNQQCDPQQNKSAPQFSQCNQQSSAKKKQEEKGDSSSKSKSKGKKENVQSINVLNRQMSRQCILPKSNFYLQKQDNLRKGLPVGRGSKKQQQRIIKERKKQVWQRSKRNKQLKQMREAKQEVKQEQDESNKSVSLDKKSSKDGGKKGKVQECTKQQSIRILNIFQVDAGDYRGMVKQLKTIPLKKIRAHLRMHFQRCIEIITRKAEESGRKIDDWDLNQKRQIVRELHRIRCTNRLLSEQNAEFRQKFMKLMRSYNDPSLTLEVSDFNYLYRKIEAFVRGFCTLNKRKTDHKFMEPAQQNRKHLLEGGYIMDLTRTLKREVKIQCKEQPPQSTKIDLQKIIYQWTEQQEKVLGKLYMENQTNYETIIEQLKKRFGERNRWKDFEILGRKIDHLVKMGINKMFDLTCKPYNRAQRLIEEESKIKSQPKEQKCLDPSTIKTGVSSLDLMTKFIYNNKKALVKPEEPPENPTFKNISLLERQIFGHVESFKVRHALVNLLREQFPPEEDLNFAVKLAKQFAEFAEEWQRQNNILQIKKQQGNDEDWAEEKRQKVQAEARQASSEDEQPNEQGDKFDELVKQLAEYQQGRNAATDRQLDLIPTEYELKQGDLQQINYERANLNQGVEKV